MEDCGHCKAGHVWFAVYMIQLLSTPATSEGQGQQLCELQVGENKKELTFWKSTCEGGLFCGPLARLAVRWVSLSDTGSTDSNDSVSEISTGFLSLNKASIYYLLFYTWSTFFLSFVFFTYTSESHL